MVEHNEIKLKAIETQYKGYRFRSRLEARWAVFFDQMLIKWEYEKEGFDLGDGVFYLPDFWLPRLGCWFEVKGDTCSDDDAEKIKRLRALSGKPVIIAIGPIGEHVYDTGDWNFNEPIKMFPIPTIKTMFKMQDNAPFEWGAQVLCPACGYDYVHFEPAVTVESDDYSAWEGRGSAIRIKMRCENGHYWTLRFGFHKGNSYCVAENVYKMLSGPEDFFSGGADILYDGAIFAALQARFEHGECGVPRNGKF